MDILFLTHNFYPEVNAPASRTYEHAKEWVKKGHKVTIITNVPHFPIGKVFEGYKNKFFHREMVDGIEVIRVLTYVTPNKGFYKRTLSFIFFMFMSIIASFKAKNVDIVCATSPQFFTAIAGWIVSVFKRKPFVFEVRDLWPDDIFKNNIVKKNSLIGKILLKIEKFLYKKAKKIIIVSHGYKKYITDLGIKEDKISVIYNGVDSDFFLPISKTECRENINAKENDFIVSYIGTIGISHGIERILVAADKLREYPDIKFMIIGEGARKNYILQKRNEMKLQDKVIIEGLKPKKEIKYWIGASDIVLAMLNKGYATSIPSKVFEYLSMEKAIIIVAEKGTLYEILKDTNTTIWANYEGESDLANKILFLYNNRKLIDEMGKNGRKFVKNEFQRSFLAEKMLNEFIRLN